MQPPWSTATSTITAPALIPLTRSSVTTIGARPPATRTAPMTRSASAARPLDRPAVGGHRHDPATVDLVDPAQTVEVLVEQDDLRLHSGGDPRRAPPDVAGTDDDHLRRAHAGSAAHQHPPPAVVALEEVGAHLRSQPAGDLAHRGEQGQGAVVEPAPSRRRCWCAGGDQRLRHIGVRGEVEVGEQRQVVAQEGKPLASAPSP